MSDQDLIRRGDVEPAIQYHVTDDDDRTTLSYALRSIPAVTSDPAVIAALPETQVLVADALERAAMMCWNKDVGHAPSSGYVLDDFFHANGGTHVGMAYAPAIRALIPADHVAALAARDAKRRAEGRRDAMERAAKIAEQRKSDGTAPLDHPYDKGYIAACDDCAAAIRAEIGGEA